MRVELVRMIAAVSLLSITTSSTLAGDDAPESQILQQLMKRLDALEEQNKELRGKLEKAPAAEPGNEALKEQLRVLQQRLDAVEKANKSGPLKPKESGDRGSDLDPIPSGGKSFADYVDGVVDKRFQEGVKKRAEAEKEAAKKKEESVLEKATGGFVVGTNRQMNASWNNGLEFLSEDEAFKLHIGGRVDFDNVWYQPTSTNMRFGSANSTRLADGSDFRRMRLRADGRIYDWVDFVFEVNFANLQDFSNQSTPATTVGAVGLTDVNLIFHDVPVVGNIRVGHLQPPISLEHMTSSNYFYYMERSPQFDAFVNRFDYVNGINFFDSYLDDRVTFASALFRSGSTTINPFGAGAGDGEYGFTMRCTGLPLYEDKGRKLIHLGLTFMERTLDNHASSPGDRALVRAGATKTDLPNVMQTGTYYSPYGEYYIVPEIAMVFGKFSLSGEYLWTFAPSAFTGMTLNSVLSGPVGMVSFQGFYVESGYFLTEGDYRRYNKSQGTWDRTTPLENGWLMRGKNGHVSAGRGALQLLARFSYLDLVSGHPVLSPTTGARAGIESDVTLGVVWYINPQANLQVNYVHTQIDSVQHSASGSFDGLGLRFHYDF